MQPIVYLKDSAKARRDAWLWAGGSLLFSAAALAVLAALLGRFELSELWSAALACLAVAVMAALAARAQLHRGAPDQNFLRLDSEQLTYAHLGRRYCWVWTELSDVELIRRGARFSALHGRGGASGHERLHRLEDVYTRPLDEIVARLNEFRRRALCGAALEPADAV